MIGIVLILLGGLSIYLGVDKVRDYRAGKNEFGPIDVTGLHPL